VAGGRKSIDERLILELASGQSVADACMRVGVSRATGFRRMAQADFRARVEEAKSEMVKQAIGRLARMSTKAADRLEDLLDSPSQKIRIEAIRTVLQNVRDLRQSEEFEKRLDQLERLAAAVHKGR
jgi:hypothetical protein